MIVSLPYRAIELLLGKADYGLALSCAKHSSKRGVIFLHLALCNASLSYSVEPHTGCWTVGSVFLLEVT
eukprot:2145-Amphidinium_carterae.1